MKRILAMVLACSAVAAWGQNEPPFTALCISTKHTGYNWEKSDWVSRDFAANKRFIVQKVQHAMSAYEGKDVSQTPARCRSIDDAIYEVDLAGTKARAACYSIKDHGSTEGLFFTAEKCHEAYDAKGRLKEVQCSNMRFSPDGLFIKLPSEASMDLNPFPKNDYKDSLILAVGKCSKIQ